jgi:hypothetical protein
MSQSHNRCECGHERIYHQSPVDDYSYTPCNYAVCKCIRFIEFEDCPPTLPSERQITIQNVSPIIRASAAMMALGNALIGLTQQYRPRRRRRINRTRKA